MTIDLPYNQKTISVKIAPEHLGAVLELREEKSGKSRKNPVDIAKEAIKGSFDWNQVAARGIQHRIFHQDIFYYVTMLLGYSLSLFRQDAGDIGGYDRNIVPGISAFFLGRSFTASKEQVHIYNPFLELILEDRRDNDCLLIFLDTGRTDQHPLL